MGPAHSPQSSDLAAVVGPWCSKCLAHCHTWKACSDLVRCSICYNYGHRKRFCLSKVRNHRRIRPKSSLEHVESPARAISSVPDSDLQQSAFASPPTCTVQPSTSSSPCTSMANFAIDPCPAPAPRFHPGGASPPPSPSP